MSVTAVITIDRGRGALAMDSPDKAVILPVAICWRCVRAFAATLSSMPATVIDRADFRCLCDYAAHAWRIVAQFVQARDDSRLRFFVREPAGIRTGSRETNPDFGRAGVFFLTSLFIELIDTGSAVKSKLCANA